MMEKVYKFQVGQVVLFTDCNGRSYNVKILALPLPDKGSYYMTEAPGYAELYIPEDMMEAIS